MALTYCYFHTSAQCRGMNPTTLTSWDDEFVRVSPPQLCELASAAYYLDIPDLVDLSCHAIADILSGKTAEQICTTFRVENDLVQSLIFPQDSDAHSTPHIQSSEPQNESTSFRTRLGDDEGPTSDEQDESKQVTDPHSPPQLGRNTIEEVESWINGDATPKKNTKKRRKKKKNKSSTLLQENSQTDSPTSYSRCPNPPSFPPLGDIAAMESSSPSSPALTPIVEGHESPVSPEKIEDYVSQDDNSRTDIRDSVSCESAAAPFDENIVFVSIITSRDHCTAPKLLEKPGREFATVECQQGSDDDQENSVRSIRSDDSSAAHQAEQQNDAPSDQSRWLFQIRGRNKRHYQTNRLHSSEISGPIYCSTDTALRQEISESQSSRCQQGSKDGALERVNVENDVSRCAAEEEPVVGCEGSCYIRCPEQLDKEVEEFKSRLGGSNTLLSESQEHHRGMREAQSQLRNHREGELCEDGLNEIGPTEGEQMEIRLEAQLVEREKLYQQRADVIEKQITDLCLESEVVRDKLSLVRMELQQLREGRGD